MVSWQRGGRRGVVASSPGSSQLFESRQRHLPVRHALHGRVDIAGRHAVDGESVSRIHQYIEGLAATDPLRRNENVFAFSTAAASFELLQMLMMIVAPLGVANPGVLLPAFPVVLQAVRKGRIAHRIVRRAVGRVTGRLLGRF